MVKIDDVETIRLTGAVSTGYTLSSMPEEKGKEEILDIEIVEFNDDHVDFKVWLDKETDYFEIRRSDKKNVFERIFNDLDFDLFVGQKMKLKITIGSNWMQHSIEYIPSEENAIVQPS